MHFNRRSFLGASGVMLSMASLASTHRPLRWKELQPELTDLRNKLSNLNAQQKERLGLALKQDQINTQLRLGTPLSYFSEADRKVLKTNLKDMNPWIEEIRKQSEYQKTTLVKDLEGKAVKMQGYFLPLRFTPGKTSTEFILVPTVGACVHTPVPPINQMVVVRFTKGHPITYLFEPIQVEGTMRLQKTNKEIHYQDGAKAIDIGYRLQAQAVLRLR